MSTSVSTVNVQNLELTPARIFWTPPGGAKVDLGATLKNVKIVAKYMKAALHMDQLGKTVVDQRVSGIEVSVETELAEVLNKDNWKVVFPHALEVTQGPAKSIVFQSAIGQKDQDIAGLLEIEPLSEALGAVAHKYTFFKAAAHADSGITMSPEGQQSLKIVWRILPDFSQSPARFFVFGDPSIGPINPVAGSVVVGGGNVGNGTVTAAVATLAAITETLTVACVGTAGANGGNFYVSGSISGPIGLVDLPGTPGGSATFSGGPITFHITDGSTDFAIGDFFTIPTTGANYI